MPRVLLPPWQAADETEHFAYANHIAEQGKVPRIGVLDFYPEYSLELQRSLENTAFYPLVRGRANNVGLIPLPDAPVLTPARQFSVTIALSAFVLALVAVLPVATPPGSNGVLDVEDHQLAGATYTGTSVTQQFLAGGDAIHTVTVYLATYGRVNRGTLKISVFAKSQKAWQRLTTRMIDEATLLDNSYNSLIFSPRLPITRGGNVRITLESDSQPTDAVTWWVDPHVQHESGARYGGFSGALRT